MAVTNYQLSLQSATWVDANSRFTTGALPDRLPDVMAINNSLFNLFNCPVGARGKIFQPEYGSEWYAFLQEPIDAITAMKMRISMIHAIQRWEPRLVLDFSNTSIVADPRLPGYKVTIAGIEVLTNTPLQIQFTEQL